MYGENLTGTDYSIQQHIIDSLIFHDAVKDSNNLEDCRNHLSTCIMKMSLQGMAIICHFVRDEVGRVLGTIRQKIRPLTTDYQMDMEATRWKTKAKVRLRKYDTATVASLQQGSA